MTLSIDKVDSVYTKLAFPDMRLLVEWSTSKNEWLKKNRNVCFEDVENCIINDEIVDVLPHPNQQKYPHQRILIVRIHAYIHYVPFVEDESRIFLKNIIPSRKLNARY